MSFIHMGLFLKEIIILIIIRSSLEECHQYCYQCFNIEYDDSNMQCELCQSGLSLLYNTTNCVQASYYPNYYIIQRYNRFTFLSFLYPCSMIPDSNCYECNPNNPNIQTGGICISCLPGYTYNSSTKKCQKCQDDEYAYIVTDFNGCKRSYEPYFCDKYITTSKSSFGEISCPDELPFYNTLTKSCEGIDCYEKGFQNGTCLVMNEKYLDRIPFINWFKNDLKYIRYPSYNTDKSGNLLIELTCELSFDPISSSYIKNKFRKFYFFDKDGRGYFNILNDEYERTVNVRKKSTRYFSTSIALKNKSNDEYSFLLNLEGMDYNLEFMDLKTFELTMDDLFDVSSFYGFVPDVVYIPSISLLELNEKNQYLMSMFVRSAAADNDMFLTKELELIIYIFNIDETNGEKIYFYHLIAYITNTPNRKIFFRKTFENIF